MAKIRRVVRKVAPPGGDYFDEQFWPVCIAIVVLGCFLMGISLAYQPLTGPGWYATVWPSLIGIPLIVAGSLVALRRIENRTFRRSLQLSLALCAILHVALVVQMIETRIFSGFYRKPPLDVPLAQHPPLRLIPEYRPTQLVPEEDRPRQEFEKPVPTRSPEPTREQEQFVRAPSETEQSPLLPQPVPIQEQQRTVEPNVVERQSPNGAAPRLAEQMSRLSRQLQTPKSPKGQLTELPQLPREAAGALALPRAATLAREQSSPLAVAATQPAAEMATTRQAPTTQLARQTEERSPSALVAAAQHHTRAVASPPDPTPANVPTTNTNTAPQTAPFAATSPPPSTVARNQTKAAISSAAKSTASEPQGVRAREPQSQMVRSAEATGAPAIASEPSRGRPAS